MLFKIDQEKDHRFLVYKNKIKWNSLKWLGCSLQTIEINDVLLRYEMLSKLSNHMIDQVRSPIKKNPFL